MTEYMELAILSVLVLLSLFIGAAYCAYRFFETRDIPNKLAWFTMHLMADACALLLIGIHVYANTKVELSEFAYFGVLMLIAIGTLWVGYMAYILRHKGTDFT